MTDATAAPEGVEAPKRSRPIWLIVLIVLVVVCCCCAALAVPIAWFAGDSALEMLGLARVTAFAVLA
jgi:flagellar basal body-associated protein FliL